ncbi:MAG: hypothetical protein HZB38_18440 [Planctomycetes bacterium]|nr:hypothetical protein [Planctomycetota bacterium]
MPALAAVSVVLLLSTATAPVTRAPRPPFDAQDSRQPGPDTILLEMLNGEQAGSDWFGPVLFNHGEHAKMAAACTVCHHYTENTQVPAKCRDCHEPQLPQDDIRKPTLKGAYHRQCMGCHREWAHGNHCQACHSLSDSARPGGGVGLHSVYMAETHAAIVRPDVITYQPENEAGIRSIVWFRHDDHIQRYGNQCVDCHGSDNCTRCHEAGAELARNMPAEHHHQPCLACHVVDDDTRCASCHSPEGTAPPERFDHALTGWPLAPYHEGLNCRACHRQAPFGPLDAGCGACHAVRLPDAQGAGRSSGAGDSPHPHEAWHEYIRKTAASDLCLICHADMASAAQSELHPLGKPEHGVPQQLIDAGARTPTDASDPGCLVCHSSETARFDLIVLPHAGPDGLCLACHAEKGRIYGSLHDIYSESDGGAEAGGQPFAGGTCRTCHRIHTAARTAAPTQGDPKGLCTGCHQPRSWAQAKPASASPHPESVCTDCHDAHDSRFGRFLAKPASQLCKECHPDQARLTGGPHDASLSPGAWPEPVSSDVAAGKGECLACHVPHTNDAAGFLRFPARLSQSGRDGACLACHENAGWNSNGAAAILHPLHIPRDNDDVDLTLLECDADGQRRMTCRTCHDPHGGTQPAYLMRTATDDPAGVCLACHFQRAYLQEFTGHSTQSLMRIGADVTSCRPCHAVHGSSDQAWGHMLSPRFLPGMDHASVDSDAACTACHRAGGPAPSPAASEHPRAPIPNALAPEAPGYLPVFDSAGCENANGQVTCRTCHLSHGRLEPSQLAGQNETQPPGPLRAMKPKLRPFLPPNYCTQCHGSEARLRFLLFHDPIRREKLASEAPPRL